MGEGGAVFQTPAEISKVVSMANRSLRVHVDTQENLSDESMARIMAQLGQFGHFCFLAGENEISAGQVADIPPLPKRDEDNKSPSQRLRNTLYRFWEQKGSTEDFELFYRTQMERFIDAIKEKLT